MYKYPHNTIHSIQGGITRVAARSALTHRLLVCEIYLCAAGLGVVNNLRATAFHVLTANLLLGLALVIALASWVKNDGISRSRSFLRVWDCGFFLLVAWPVVMPVYLVRTRGRSQGVLIVFAFMGCLVLGAITAKLASRN